MKEPKLMKANDERVLVNGRTLPVPFRIIAEDNYQLLLEQKKELLAALQEIVEMQHNNYGDGVNTHIELRILCKAAKETINKAL